MAGMGSVVTVSTRVRPGEYERMAKSRAARDGVTQFAAVSSSGRQLRLLRQVRDHLAADSALDVFGGGDADYGDGYTYLTVYPAGQRQAAVWGQPNGAEEAEPGDVDVEILPDDFWDGV